MNNQRIAQVLSALGLLAFNTAGSAWGAEAASATAAEAEARLKAIVALLRAKGPDAAKDIMGADDPAKCRYKDMSCMVVDVSNDNILVQTALPKLVGQKLDYEMRDPDGVAIGDQMAGPAKRGEGKWEARWKFARPDSKKITQRWATCATADATRAVCVSITQP